MTLSDIRLYHFPLSRSARVRWALHETVGDDFELENVALTKGAGFTPEFLRMNPNHAVPVLAFRLNDGPLQHMIESAAIVEWLLDAYSEKSLAPAPGASAQRADYLQMMHFAGSWMDMMLWQIRLHRDLLPASEADPATTARYLRKWADEVEPQLLARLASTPFICGEEFCGADILVGHNVRWAQAYGLCAHEAFVAYRKRLGERPAYKKAFSDAADFPS